MTSIIVDPYLVILPEPCYSSEQLDQFVEGLLSWSEALARKDVDIFLSDRCIHGLYQDKWYPYHGRITPLLKQFGNDNADEETINQVVRQIFERTPRLEEYTRIEELEYDKEAITISPDLVIKRLGKNTANAFIETLVIAGLAETYLMTLMPESFLATAPCNDLEEDSKLTTQVSVVFVIASEDAPRQVEDNDFPISLTSELTICFGHENVLSRIDTMALWGDAIRKEQITDAINAKIREHRKIGLPPDRREFQTFRLCEGFIPSLQKYSFDARPDLARNVIDSCARIVLGVPKNPVEPFREDERPQAPQRTRKSDAALAWRTHLTKGAEGFRLMFWETQTGIIDFANVGPKKELIIDDDCPTD